MISPRQIAVCNTVEELRDAIAAYCAAQHVTRRELDRRAGLGEGHSAKLLSPRSIRKFGLTSLRWVMEALELELVVQIRDDAAAIDFSKNHAHDDAHGRKTASQDWRRNRGRAWGKRYTGLRMLRTTPEQRSAIARKAARTRWSRRPQPGPDVPA